MVVMSCSFKEGSRDEISVGTLRIHSDLEVLTQSLKMGPPVSPLRDEGVSKEK